MVRFVFPITLAAGTLFDADINSISTYQNCPRQLLRERWRARRHTIQNLVSNWVLYLASSIGSKGCTVEDWLKEGIILEEDGKLQIQPNTTTSISNPERRASEQASRTI